MSKRKGVLRIMLVCLVVLLALFASGPVLALQTGAMQGDVAVNLASTLGLSLPPSATGQDAINALSALGISPATGWSANSLADSNFIAALYNAVQSAFNAGKISPTGGLTTPSSIVAAACTASNIPQSEVVAAIKGAGGDSDAATQGAAFGMGAGSGPAYYGPGLEGGSPGSGGGGGGVNPSPNE